MKKYVLVLTLLFITSLGGCAALLGSRGGQSREAIRRYQDFVNYLSRTGDDELIADGERFENIETRGPDPSKAARSCLRGFATASAYQRRFAEHTGPQSELPPPLRRQPEKKIAEKFYICRSTCKSSQEEEGGQEWRDLGAKYEAKCEQGFASSNSAAKFTRANALIAKIPTETSFEIFHLMRSLESELRQIEEDPSMRKNPQAKEVIQKAKALKRQYAKTIKRVAKFLKNPKFKALKADIGIIGADINSVDADLEIWRNTRNHQKLSALRSRKSALRAKFKAVNQQIEDMMTKARINQRP